MNNKTILLAMLLFWGGVLNSLAQTISAVRPIELGISDSFTTSVLFPYSIIKASWCSPMIAVQHTAEVSNLLEVRATAADVAPTNVTVVTSDGQLYCLLLHYEKRPAMLALRIGKDTVSLAGPVQFADGVSNAAVLSTLADSVRAQPGFLSKSRRSNSMQATVQGLYVAGGMTWLKMRLSNGAAYSTAVDEVSLSTASKKQGKRSLAMETSITIRYDGLPLRLAPSAVDTVFLAFDPVRLQKGKRLVLRLYGPRGVTLLTIPLSQRHLQQAKLISKSHQKLH